MGHEARMKRMRRAERLAEKIRDTEAAVREGILAPEVAQNAIDEIKAQAFEIPGLYEAVKDLLNREPIAA